VIRAPHPRPSGAGWGELAAVWSRLVKAPVARLATVTSEGRVDLVPFVFAPIGDDRLVSAVDHKPKKTTALQRLTNIGHTPAVTVLADHYAEDWTELWWVRARGVARVHPSPAGVSGALEALVSKYSQYREVEPTGPLIEISVTDLRSWSADGSL